jgi:hypothetical protein
MLKAWLSAIGFALFSVVGVPLICRTGCNSSKEVIVAGTIAILFYISFYYIIMEIAKALKIEIDKNNKRRVSIYIGILSLFLFTIFMLGFKSMESITVIDLTK